MMEQETEELRTHAEDAAIFTWVLTVLVIIVIALAVYFGSFLVAGIVAIIYLISSIYSTVNIYKCRRSK